MAPRRAATRGSTLARRQTDLVLEALGDPGIEHLVVSTRGDDRADVPLWKVGGTGVFVKEVQAAVAEGRADIAVHSAKDLPSSPADGLVIGAVLPRGDPRDALVGRELDDLPPGAKVGTGSVRRRAQLAWLRPDLTFGGLRGNLETRLEKARGFGAIVVAAAALARMGRRVAAVQLLAPGLVVPQVGQGTIAVECRADDRAALDLLAPIDHRDSRIALDAERAFLAALGGGCDLPVGAYAQVSGGRVRMLAVMGSLDGSILMRHSAEAGVGAAADLGRAVAEHLLDEGGGRALLERFALDPVPVTLSR